jgi:hypothetical protein
MSGALRSTKRLVAVAASVLLVTLIAFGQQNLPPCTGLRFSYQPHQPNCPAASQCEELGLDQCGGRVIVPVNGAVQYFCTSEGAVASNNCISIYTAEQCAKVYECVDTNGSPGLTNCGVLPQQVPIGFVWFNQAAEPAGHCIVITTAPPGGEN